MPRWGCSVSTLMAVGILVSGCADNVWVKPGASTQAFETDKYACERDARQSGGFGSGIAGAIEVREFFNRCMVAHGWRMQGREQATSQAVNNQSIIQAAMAQNRTCRQQIRQNNRYNAINMNFPDIATGRYNFTQMSNAQIPTVREAELLAAYFNESTPCYETYLTSVRPVITPAQLQALQANRSETEALAALLVRRQVSWGEFSTRSNQAIDAGAARYQSAR